MKGCSDTVYQVNIKVLHFRVLPKIEDLRKNIFVNDSRGHVERCGNTFVELIFAKSTRNEKFEKKLYLENNPNLLLSFRALLRHLLNFFKTFPYQVSFPLCHAHLLRYNKARVTNFFQQWRKTCDCRMRDLVFSQPQSGIPG